MSLKYKPASEPLHIYVKYRVPIFSTCDQSASPTGVELAAEKRWSMFFCIFSVCTSDVHTQGSQELRLSAVDRGGNT